MTQKFNTTFSTDDFSPEEMKGLENKIAQLFILKENQRSIGSSFIYKGVLFTLDGIFYDFDNDMKILHICQMTRLKRLVEPIHGNFKAN